MPRVPNFLDLELRMDDNCGWDDLPGQTYDVPIWMERMGLLQIPDWMRAEDGSCTVDYRIGMGYDKPKIYVTSLEKISPSEEEDNVFPKKKLCRFFAKNNRCKYGENCRFSHEAPGSKKPDVSKGHWIPEKELKKSYDQIAREAREKREDEAGKPIKICQYYLDIDGCKRGVHCPRRHIEEDGSLAKRRVYSFYPLISRGVANPSRYRLNLIGSRCSAMEKVLLIKKQLEVGFLWVRTVNGVLSCRFST
ncbi:hypothetical protein BZA05DRAFT_392840 [Tricharina praecox]|uniref:uncharacterized protein n=1 Tax=Tricharina praecox TaxID=43433 RepID=UPI00221E3C3E|nr:uncharacterized protein BZA05DRAFT_392840 [Tricharina praecox]KAI5854876.1 hypothetical protein BZA05DRAFT_392840 [Tricharina praecox]